MQKLTTLIPAVLLMAAPAANAIDYVKCEAMQKAWHRNNSSRIQADQEVHKRWIKKSREACPYGALGPEAKKKREACQADWKEQNMTQWAAELVAASHPYEQSLKRIEQDIKAEGCN